MAARIITPNVTPTPMPAFAPSPKPVLEESRDGDDEDAAGVEADVEAVVEAKVAEVLVDEEAVEVENPGPIAPPIVVTLTKSPRKKTPACRSQQVVSPEYTEQHQFPPEQFHIPFAAFPERLPIPSRSVHKHRLFESSNQHFRAHHFGRMKDTPPNSMLCLCNCLRIVQDRRDSR